ncbi:MAG: RNA pseudouridine synthase [Flavobacteriia bacterium]|nr:RNA pseudouridine synthase [Flavobacteriia bacterium]
MKSFNTEKITYFDQKMIRDIKIPDRFNYPHNYEPHPLCQIAADELKNYISNHFGSEFDFKVGKMFGVLIVEDAEGKLGYLSGFSGKLNNSNQYPRFVPPVFDMLDDDGFYRKGEQQLNQINRKIEVLKNLPEYTELNNNLEKYRLESVLEISAFKKQMKLNKSDRKQLRETKKQQLDDQDYQEFEKELIRQSNLDQFKFKILKRSWKREIDRMTEQAELIKSQIKLLKKERKDKSNQLQDKLFEQYTFLNKDGKEKSLGEIFKETVFEKPPSGAGECATPKLLQYAFKNHLKPIVFAEFWYGPSPESEIRKHSNFYPACSGKCRPILKHMLKGIPVDENPVFSELSKEKQLKIVFEDDSIIVVNKPNELLSIPGIEIQDSVYTRLQEKSTDFEPLIVHRLDMSTSGLMVVAKTKKAHKNLQNQFLKQSIKKRYTALLDGVPATVEGEINLPLRPDPLDRPRQQLDFKHGKKALTVWKLIREEDGKALVHFWPKTGRTHQLRVHSAHRLGLDTPIVGDELYGKPADRLYLHAAVLEFVHPTTGEMMRFEDEADFG